MKRDMDLVLKILRTVEATPAGIPVTAITVEGAELPVVYEHVAILIDEGLVKGECYETMGAPPDFIIRRLTWNGHELLALSENEKLWNQLKARAKQEAMGISMHLLLTGLRLGATEWARLAVGQIVS